MYGGTEAMKYQCENCHKTFAHPMKQRVYIKSDADRVIAVGSTFASNPADFSEFNTCPFCGDKNFSEFIEPQEDITSVRSVDLAQVDDYLKQGYKVRELYAKTATLVKMEAKQA